ncbi:8-amino-7-oxononanoate synthase [Bermanella marisrubri]|uniref:8-amino-7-oxononanoate synthase n=1 Tax=Bermanella marisrubri TaxID=207949 RepID=Q1MZV7_9GAMM|nr:8-amino-7-oxononanoate synthase [Bermanella marisrubri]EAT11450.1 8-amino-7-oxononanoate synthase [Oceanobacter sp. RED65] [Bermanella marisrubri]QIZ85028.1 8-amino-7-oxononanoate synthase [Bermanella marisrubri]
MSSTLDHVLYQALNERRERNLYRQCRVLSSPQGPQVEINGRTMLSFCSNDYLGLANDARIIQRFKDAADEMGVGSGAAHLVNGHNYYHQALEEALAEFTNRPRALLFSTGYMANMGVIASVLNKQDAVFEDKWNHASLIDGGLLSGARFQRYLHKDLENLNQRLLKTQANQKMIVTDGVFSMDGDCADLPRLANTAKKHNAWLMVDDAHGFGVLGDNGAGLCEAQNVSGDDVPILMATLGKGLGTAGAFVAGSEALIEYLTNFARPYIYTTAMPAAVAAATLTSLQIVKEDAERRIHLQSLISQFRQGARQLGFELMNSSTPIQPIIVGEADQALLMTEALNKKGIHVAAIRPPTVPEGTSRLRVTLSASHSEAHVNQLLQALEDIQYLNQ